MICRPLGGTEQAVAALFSRIGYGHSISVSDALKPADILWQHQSYDQPSVQAIRYTQKNYKKIVFVSEWQSQMFQKYLNVDPSLCVVIGNGVNPLPIHKKPTDCINLFYSSTPFRGLDVLINAFSKLDIPNVYLHVFSSMGIYGRDDLPYDELYQKIKKIKNTRYYGAVPPVFLHDWIAKNGHIMAYPNTWEETYCIAAHEAMSGRALVVCPSRGALPETVPHGIFYTHDENDHIDNFSEKLKSTIINYIKYESIINIQKNYADQHNWDFRAKQWLALLNSID